MRELLEAAHDERGPPGLVARTQAPPVLRVEVLVEQNEVFPRGVRLEARVLAVARAAPVCAGHEDARQPARELIGDITQAQEISRPRGALDLERLAVKVV